MAAIYESHFSRFSKKVSMLAACWSADLFNENLPLRITDDRHQQELAISGLTA